MPHLTTRRTLLMLALAALALPGLAQADAVVYRIDPDQTRVGFGYLLGGSVQTGDMPVADATILIDPTDLAASRVDVTLDVARARADLILATGALKGPGMLDTTSHPHARFTSTAIRLAPSGRISDGARIEGDLTIRGITLPVALAANLTRAAGTAPDDLRELTIRLTGDLSRSAFGVSGYPRLVGDVVTLDIVATIRAAP